MKSLPRLSASPEKLLLAGITYSVESPCARTFLFVGDVVAWSHQPQLDIINGLRKMADAQDLKTATDYSTRFSGELNPVALQDFQENWTGVLGDVRDTFNAQSGVFVDFYDKPHTLYLRSALGFATAFIAFRSFR